MPAMILPSRDPSGPVRTALGRQGAGKATVMAPLSGEANLIQQAEASSIEIQQDRG